VATFEGARRRVGAVGHLNANLDAKVCFPPKVAINAMLLDPSHWAVWTAQSVARACMPNVKIK